MLSYLIDVYYYQLRDLAGVNYGWILRRFIAFFLVGLLIGIVATNAWSDIRSDFKTGSIEIWFDDTGDRKKVYLYKDAEVTRWIEGNEHFSELTWEDGYCLKFSHYHKSKANRSSPIPAPPAPATSVTTPIEPVPPASIAGIAIPTHTVETNIIDPPEKPKRELPPPLPLQPLRVTEYMMRDGGSRRLPTWVEMWNPNSKKISLKGYMLTWATRKFVSSPWEYHTHTIGDFSIPANGTVILASRRLTRLGQYGGIEDSQVYDLGIRRGRLLKSGWRLTDLKGAELFSVGRAFGKGGPVLNGTWRMRASHERYASEQPLIPHFYGNKDDSGSPGFYRELSPAAPSAVRRKRVGTWASLKHQKDFRRSNANHQVSEQ